MAWMVDKLFKDDKLPGTLRAASCKSVQEFHKWVRQRDDYSRMFYREVRNHRAPAPARAGTRRNTEYSHRVCASARSGTSTASTGS